MDVLGLYLLQRVSDQITIQKNQSFENRFFSRIPDNTVARLENDGYITASKDVSPVITKGYF